MPLIGVEEEHASDHECPDPVEGVKMPGLPAQARPPHGFPRSRLRPARCLPVGPISIGLDD